MVGVDIDAAGAVRLFDREGETSTCALDGRGRRGAIARYAVPLGKRPDDIAEVALSAGDELRARFHDGTWSRGTPADVSATQLVPGPVAGMAISLDTTFVLYRSGYAKAYRGTLADHFRPQRGPWTGDWALGPAGDRGWTGAYYRLPEGATPWDVVGVAYDPPRSVFVLWYRDGLRSEAAGVLVDGVRDLSGPLIRSEASAELLVEAGIASGAVYRWYGNGLRTQGSLDASMATRTSSLPAGRRWSQVAGIDIAWPSLTPAAGTQYSWALYDDGAVSKGITYVLGQEGYCALDRVTPCVFGP
jgi:hypothetical protein